MSPAAAPAAAAVLLAAAAIRELLAVRSARTDDARFRSASGFPGQPRILLAALRLGLPERLARSGLDTRFPLQAVVLAKLIGAGVGGLAAMSVAPAAPGRLASLIALGLLAAGFLAPDALLEREGRRRHRRLVAALPDALDLLAVGSSSGRSAATGLAEIARAGDGPLAAELRIVGAELGCGRSLAEALRSLRARVPGSEVATSCAAIERSHRLGSPLADQLRRHATALRRDRRRLVEERAARAAPKIQLVVALVLVPSVLLTIAAGLVANADLLLSGF